MTIITLWAALVLIGLAAAFGVPLVHGITHLVDRLPSYVASAGRYGLQSGLQVSTVPQCPGPTDHGRWPSLNRSGRDDPSCYVAL